MGIKSVSIYDGVYQWWVVGGKVRKEKMDYSSYQMAENLKIAQVKYGGTEKIGGHKTHILNVKDLNKMMGAEGMQKVSGRFWVDARDWFIRKMELEYLEIYAIRKPAFHGKETVNSMMLLPLFNFIGGKERMKLLRNFHLTKVKQNFFLLYRGCSDTETNNKAIFINKSYYLLNEVSI